MLPKRLTMLGGQTRYTVEQLLELRRQMLRFARSIPPGPARNERRQIADSPRRLFKNKEWLDAHLVEESTTEDRVNMVEADGHSHKAIEIVPMMPPQLKPRNSSSTAKISNS